MSNLEETLAFQIQAIGLPAPEREYRFHDKRKWRFDFCYPKIQLAIEVQGGTWNRGAHGRGSGIAQDYKKNNAAVLLGWRIMYFTSDMIKSGQAVNDIEAALK